MGIVAHQVRVGVWGLLLLVLAGSAGFRASTYAQQKASPAAVNQTGGTQADRIERLIDDGVAAFERGDFDVARDSFQKVLNLNPKHLAAHTYLGVLADRAGDLKNAEGHFAQAARLAPSSATARNNYGAVLLRLGRTREAAGEFEASLKSDAKQANALVNLAQIRFNGGTPDDLRVADDLFQRAYAISPDADIARSLTVVALRRKDSAAAATRYQEYATRLAAEVGAAGNSAGSRAELGSALLEAGLLREAETELTAAAQLDPANPDAFVRLARVHLARKDLPAAGRTLEGSVARGIDSAPLYALLAEVYEQSGHPENAIPAMRLAIQRDPQSENYRFAYGLLLTNSYAPAAAVIRLEEALKSFPTSPRLLFALGMAHFKQNKNNEAADFFQRAVEIDPKFAPAFAYLGMTRVGVGSYDEGIAFYEKALQVDPKLAVVHYLIADAMLKLPEAKPALIESHLQRGVELDPTFAPARLALAKILVRAGRWTEAVAALQKVVQLDPNMTEAYYQLGRAYGRLKRPAEAQQALATFKRLSDTQKDREQSDIQEVVRRLAHVRF